MQFIIENWAAVSGIIVMVSGFIAVLVKFMRKVAYKHELYKTDGQPVYLHKQEFKEKEKKFTKGIDDIKSCLDTMDSELKRDRKITYGFMAAVSENMDLKFKPPND